MKGALPLIVLIAPALGLSVKPARVKFGGLSADAFRHPLDKSQTSLVQNIPFSSPVETLIRKRLLPVVEEVTHLPFSILPPSKFLQVRF